MDTEETDKLVQDLDNAIMALRLSLIPNNQENTSIFINSNDERRIIEMSDEDIFNTNYQTKEYLHEVTDRASCIQEMFGRLVQEHPAVEQNEELSEEAEEVMDVLYSFYCKAGDLMFACQDE